MAAGIDVGSSVSEVNVNWVPPPDSFRRFCIPHGFLFNFSPGRVAGPSIHAAIDADVVVRE